MKKPYECLECGETFTTYSEQCPKCKTNFSIERRVRGSSCDEENGCYDYGFEDFIDDEE